MKSFDRLKVLFRDLILFYSYKSRNTLRFLYIIFNNKLLNIISLIES